MESNGLGNNRVHSEVKVVETTRVEQFAEENGEEDEVASEVSSVVDR